MPSENFVWEVQEIGQNLYKVQFPSRADLERLQVFRPCRVPNSECEMIFDRWAHAPQPTETLPEIWVRISGIPWIHRGDFLALWPIGDMFGKTLKIDMKYTRKHGVLRILIGCLNWSKIPARFPLFIKDGFYSLTFDVEGEERPEVDDMETDNQHKDEHDDDGGLGDDFQEALAKDSQHTSGSIVKETTTTLEDSASGGGTDVPPTQSATRAGVLFSPSVRSSIQKAKEELAALGRDLMERNSDRESEVDSVCLSSDSTQMVKDLTDKDSSPLAYGSIVEPEVLAKDIGSMAPTVEVRVYSPVRQEVARVGVDTPICMMEPEVSAMGFGPMVPPVEVCVNSQARQEVVPVGVDTTVCMMEPEVTAMGFGPMAPTAEDGVSSPVRQVVVPAGVDTSRFVDGALTPCSPITPGGGGGSSEARTPPRMPTPLGEAGDTLSLAQRAMVADFGGVPDPLAMGIRSSGRIRAQDNADSTQMARAMALLQRRDSTPGKNLNPNFSLLSIPDERIIDHATRLGVSLGATTQTSKNSVKLIKESEAKRQLHILEKNISASLNDNGNPTSLVLDRASCLSEDMDDDELLGAEVDHLDLLPKPVNTNHKRTKKVATISNRRRSARLKKQIVC